MKKKTKDYGTFGVTEGQNGKTVDLDVGKVQKEFLSILLYQTKQRNNLLGAFSADGKYSISDEKILKELISLPKKFDEKENNVVYSSAKIDGIVLNFKIELGITESFCEAKLSIIEVEHGIEEDKKHVTKLAEHLAIYSPKFKEDVYKLWKVYFDEEVYEKNDSLYNYLHMQKEEFLFARELTEILSQLYLVRLLKILDSCGELGEKIKWEYKLLVEKFLSKNPGIAQDNTKLKQILDSVIIKNKAFAELLKNKEAAMILNGYYMPIQRIKEKTAPAGIKEMGAPPAKEGDKKKDDKKQEKKPAAKSKGGGGGGGSVKPFIYDFSKAFGTSYGGYKMPDLGSAAPAAKKEEPKTQTKPKAPAETTPPPRPVQNGTGERIISDEDLIATFKNKQNTVREELNRLDGANVKNINDPKIETIIK